MKAGTLILTELFLQYSKFNLVKLFGLYNSYWTFIAEYPGIFTSTLYNKSDVFSMLYICLRLFSQSPKSIIEIFLSLLII